MESLRFQTSALRRKAEDNRGFLREMRQSTHRRHRVLSEVWRARWFGSAGKSNRTAARGRATGRDAVTQPCDHRRRRLRQSAADRWHHRSALRWARNRRCRLRRLSRQEKSRRDQATSHQRSPQGVQRSTCTGNESSATARRAGRTRRKRCRERKWSKGIGTPRSGFRRQSASADVRRRCAGKFYGWQQSGDILPGIFGRSSLAGPTRQS